MNPLTVLAPHSIVRTVTEHGMTEAPGAQALGYAALADAIPWPAGADLADDVPSGEHVLLVPSDRLDEVEAAGRLAMAFVLDASPSALLTLVADRGLAGATDGMTLHRWRTDPAARGPVDISGWSTVLRTLGYAADDARPTSTVFVEPPLPDAIAAYLRAYLPWRSR